MLELNVPYFFIYCQGFYKINTKFPGGEIYTSALLLSKSPNVCNIFLNCSLILEPVDCKSNKMPVGTFALKRLQIKTVILIGL